MKKGLLIVNEFIKKKKERFIALYEELESAFSNNNIKLDVMTNCEALIIINDKEKPDYDFVLFWDKDVNLAYHLENLGYKVFNSARAIELCDDKAKTALALEKSDLLLPKTIIAPFTFTNNPFIESDLSFLDNVIDELSLPLILKESFGSFGEQVYLIHNKEELINKVLEISPKPMLFQEFVASSIGMDIRIEVVGDKALGAVKRESLNNDFRSNVLQGGKMSKVEVNDDFYNAAVKACQIIGLDFAGVDILIGKNGEPIFCEINSNVHFKTFYKTTGINLASEIVKYIVNKI